MLTTAEASAKDVCVNTGAFNLVLRKVKALKPSGAVGLAGFAYYDADSARPCDGSATMNAAGTIINVGLVCHGRHIQGSTIMFDWTAADKTLAGPGSSSFSTSFSTSSPIAVTSVECDGLTPP
ncbi:MAG TPA: hypothetical protein VEC57_19860 [Candidatus Limnocylindrales bacterium]|nr:hypothetical protein [Candidatus Limnocylindrales bacterium]